MAVYLINNVYDPICGCDVASHDVSTLKGEVLKKGEEKREGLLSHCGGDVSPVVHALDFHTFSNTCLGLRHGSACA